MYCNPSMSASEKSCIAPSVWKIQRSDNTLGHLGSKTSIAYRSWCLHLQLLLIRRIPRKLTLFSSHSKNDRPRKQGKARKVCCMFHFLYLRSFVDPVTEAYFPLFFIRSVFTRQHDHSKAGGFRRQSHYLDISS
jgi:hypothetical protein